MFDALEAWLVSYADTVPLPLFAALASFAEELIAPIPSGPVMMVVGTLARVQEYPMLGLLLVTLCAVAGKTVGGLAVYAIADKAEDFLSGRIAKFSGITHEQIESFGARFGNGWKDYVLLTVLRTLPFVPSAVVSAGAGLLKLPVRMFVAATLVGSFLRDFAYLYLGYTGIAAAEAIVHGASTAEKVFLVALALALCIGGGYYLYRRHRRAPRP